MTRQLEEARRVVESNRAALEAAKAHLENILANLSAGVLVYDHELGLTISNRGAPPEGGAELETFSGRMRERFAADGAGARRAWLISRAGGPRGEGREWQARARRAPAARHRARGSCGFRPRH